jgi:phosphoglycolate phosphatase-like HAD superfamily hydrolase
MAHRAPIDQGTAMDKGICVFDWNGTLQDDAAYIYECGVQRIFRAFGLPCPSLETYKDEVAADFMAAFYWPHGIPKDVTAEHLNAIMADGFKERGKPPELFSDAVPVLNELRHRGYALMVASGYATAKLEAAIVRNGLAGHFSAVFGDVRDKAGAIRACASAGMRPVIAKVGDTTEDMLGAHAAGVIPYICPRGFHTRERIAVACAQAPSTVVVENLTVLLDHLP